MEPAVALDLTMSLVDIKDKSAEVSKRSLRSFSDELKIKTIQRVKKGESKTSVGRDIDCPESTLRGWCKAEEKILAKIMAKRSREEKAAGPSNAKKIKLDVGGSGCSLNDNSESREAKLEGKQQQQQQQSQMDNANILINTLVPNGMRSVDNSRLIQHLGLLSLSSSAASRTENLLNLTNSGLAASTNNEQVLDLSVNAPADSSSDEEGLKHGEEFLKWLTGCEQPVATRLQILQIERLIERLKNYKTRTTNNRSSKGAQRPARKQ